MSTDRLKILVVDDTVTYRKIVSDTLSRLPAVEVVGTASNGSIALQKIDQLKPDLLTLDLEMPVMNGLDLLRELKHRQSTVGTIMLSAFTAKGAETTMDALKLGAFDFVLKPSGSDMRQSADALYRELGQKIEAFRRTYGVQRILQKKKSSDIGTITTKPTPAAIPAPSVPLRRSRIKCSPQVIGIGISTGGPKALNELLPKLPKHLPIPILIVQHMPPIFTKSLADDLNNKCSLHVSEACDMDVVEPGRILIAPGGKQMKVVESGGRNIIVIKDDPPENNCKPAVDYLFRSISHTYGGRSIAVIMTGMGSDGTLGIRLLKRQNAHIVAQDAQSCVVYGMPKQPIEEGLADDVVPLSQMATHLTQLACKGELVCR